MNPPISQPGMVGEITRLGTLNHNSLKMFFAAVRACKPHQWHRDRSPFFRPWMVTLSIQASPDPADKHMAVYWVRSLDGGDAGSFADILWQKWERPDKHIPWPDTEGQCAVTVIDENDYAKAWKAARRFYYEAVGSLQNPLGFTVWKDEKQKESRRRRPIREFMRERKKHTGKIWLPEDFSMTPRSTGGLILPPS